MNEKLRFTILSLLCLGMLSAGKQVSAEWLSRGHRFTSGPVAAEQNQRDLNQRVLGQIAGLRNAIKIESSRRGAAVYGDHVARVAAADRLGEITGMPCEPGSHHDETKTD